MDHLEWLPEEKLRTSGATERGAGAVGAAPEAETIAPLVALREAAGVVMEAAEERAGGARV
jgi:hypothetical protein